MSMSELERGERFAGNWMHQRGGILVDSSSTIECANSLPLRHEFIIRWELCFQLVMD